jgi:thiol-disulfide isomerase/thioredoxin
MKRPFLILALLTIATPTIADDVRPFLRGTWQHIKEAHGGRRTVVHFWGITCAPCMSELPRWGQLQRQHPKAALVFVAADPVPVDESRIASATVKSGISAGENWIFTDLFAERLRYEVNPAWAGELPYTVMIDVDGQMSCISGVTNLSDIRTWMDGAK